MPHKCHGNANNCPTRSQPIWELPINELDRREDPSFDERLSGCHLVSSCSNVYDPSQFKTLLEHNFNRYEYLMHAWYVVTGCTLTIYFFRHYGQNRAPLSLSFDTAWLQVNKGFTRVLQEWIREKLSSQSDVYFVTELQVRNRFDKIVSILTRPCVEYE